MQNFTRDVVKCTVENIQVLIADKQVRCATPFTWNASQPRNPQYLGSLVSLFWTLRTLHSGPFTFDSSHPSAQRYPPNPSHPTLSQSLNLAALRGQAGWTSRFALQPSRPSPSTPDDFESLSTLDASQRWKPHTLVRVSLTPLTLDASHP